MPLTDTAVRNAKGWASPCQTADGGGLYLLVSPNGARWWCMVHRFQGKQQTLAFGVYPEVTLVQAHEQRAAACKLLAGNASPLGINGASQAVRRRLRSGCF
jgi:hypothetical protein